MLNLILFVLFAFGVFCLSLAGYPKFKYTAFYALAIGGVVNANFFHAVAYPVYIFNLPFGIDSVIYTLFAFCITVCLLQDGKRSAYILAFSSIIAIMFSATMQLVADLLSSGSSRQVWLTFSTFTISAVASVIAIRIAIEVLSRLKSKLNGYICLLIGMVLITFINSSVYYPLSLLINSTPNNIWYYLQTSFLGKLIAMACGVVVFYLINLKEKKILNKEER